jgi:hypothetical protein
MDQILEDYKAYYRSRMEQYEGNPLYANSYQSEKALYEAMASCSELIEFKDKMGNLNIKNGIALILDKEGARKKHFEELKEFVRAAGPAENLEKIGAAQTDMDLVNIASDIETKHSRLIAIDLFTDAFYPSYWRLLEHIEMEETAEIPDEWKAEAAENKREWIQRLNESIRDDEDNNKAWEPTWKFDPQQVWEDRHRRKIPVPDEAVTKRISEYNQHKGG